MSDSGSGTADIQDLAPEWDRELLRILASGDLSPVDAFDPDEMTRIAALDTGASLFFDHRDPAMVSTLGNARIHD